MMIPEFIRFYSYTTKQALGEFAVTFFSLINAMYRLQAKESLNDIMAVSVGNAGKDGDSAVAELNKQAKGLHGIIQEVRIVKG